MENASPLDTNHSLAVLRQQARLASVVEKIPALVSITNEVFLGAVTFDIEEDPEIPNAQYVVIRVDAKPPLQDVAKRRKEWNNLTYRLLGEGCELVQLSVTVVE